MSLTKPHVKALDPPSKGHCKGSIAWKNGLLKPEAEAGAVEEAVEEIVAGAVAEEAAGEETVAGAVAEEEAAEKAPGATAEKAVTAREQEKQQGKKQEKGSCDDRNNNRGIRPNKSSKGLTRLASQIKSNRNAKGTTAKT